MSLNTQQSAAIDGIITLMQQQVREAVLYGAGGTGKTFTCKSLINRVVEEGLFSNANIFLMAPTHKAAGVLAKQTGRKVSTIHSAFGLKMRRDRDGVMRVDTKNPVMDTFGVLFEGNPCMLVVDESSMVSRELRSVFEKFLAHNLGNFILYMGDDAQLPPVETDNNIGVDLNTGERIGGMQLSPVWNIPSRFELREVMRYAGRKMELCHGLREYILGRGECPRFASLHGEDEHGAIAVYSDSNHFEQNMLDVVGKGKFAEGEAIAVAYRNNTVQDRSNLIRQAMFQNPGYIEPGDRIVATGALTEWVDGETRVVVQNQQEFKVVQVEDFTKVIDVGDEKRGIPCYKIKTEDHKFLYVLRPEFEHEVRQLKTWLRENSNAARSAGNAQAAKKMWAQYCRLSESTFLDWQFAYSITSHRSQGSTYDTVFVDARDIWSVGLADRNTKLRALYTAVSRASTDLHILI